MRAPLSLFLSALLCFASALSAVARDVTFYLVSDAHVGMIYKQCEPAFTAEDYNQNVVRTLDALATLPGRPWPKQGPLAEAMKGKGTVPAPLAMIVAGDLTEVGSPAQWKDFDRLFPWQGEAPKRFPVIALAGNHDGGSKTGIIRQGLRDRNAAMLKAGLLAKLSADGLHSAWVWQGVHFINANNYAGDVVKADAKPGSMWDPEKSLTFMKEYLASISPGAPVVIVQHLDYSERSTWWDQERRKAFYDVIKGYNVIALLHGHTHAITKLTFPEDKDYAAFGNGGPRFDCFSAGAFKREGVIKGQPFPGPRNPCECYVFRITDDTFAAGHFTAGPDGWNSTPQAGALTVVKKIR